MLNWGSYEAGLGSQRKKKTQRLVFSNVIISDQRVEHRNRNEKKCGMKNDKREDTTVNFEDTLMFTDAVQFVCVKISVNILK